MTRRLTLRSERLAELTEDELRLAAGAGTWTGQVLCIVSVEKCATNLVCTSLCLTGP